MSLTREQHNRIMREYSSRRLKAVTLQEKRQEEVEEQIPALLQLNEQIASASVHEAEARIKHVSKDAQKYAEERHELLKRKKALLKENGFPDDYLEIAYECEYCKDTGYIGTEKCGCLRKLESIILNEESGLPKLLSAENFDTFNISVFNDTELLSEFLPKYKMTQAEYMKKNILPEVKKYIIEFGKNGHRNMLLTGPAGTGKTFISNCIARWLLDRQHTVMYVKAGDFFDALSKNTFGKDQDADIDPWIERIKNCELLVIDDLGTEFVTEYTRSRLFSLISHRLSGNLSTIISTNLSVNQISQVYGERMASRLVGEYMLLPFYGKDIRMGKGL